MNRRTLLGRAAGLAAIGLLEPTAPVRRFWQGWTPLRAAAGEPWFGDTPIMDGLIPHDLVWTPSPDGYYRPHLFTGDRIITDVSVPLFHRMPWMKLLTDADISWLNAQIAGRNG